MGLFEFTAVIAGLLAISAALALRRAAVNEWQQELEAIRGHGTGELVAFAKPRPAKRFQSHGATRNGSTRDGMVLRGVAVFVALLLAMTATFTAAPSADAQCTYNSTIITGCAADDEAPSFIEATMPSPAIFAPGALFEVPHLAADSDSGVNQVLVTWYGPNQYVVFAQAYANATNSWSETWQVEIPSDAPIGTYEVADIYVGDDVGNSSNYFADGSVSSFDGTAWAQGNHALDLAALSFQVEPAEVTLVGVELVIASGDPLARFLFSSPSGLFELGDGESTSFDGSAGTVLLTMTSTGWDVVVDCGLAPGTTGVLGVDGLTPVSIDLAPGDTPNCIFTVTETGAHAAPLSGPPSTNLCPSDSHSVLLYASLYDLPLAPGLTGLTDALDGSVADDGSTICVQQAPKASWATATTADFAQFDVLWIGSDYCAGTDASDFDEAIASRSVWEQAIDRDRLVVIGGDIDVHYLQDNSAARDIAQDLVQFADSATATGLVLHAGCYGMRGQNWFDSLGGSFVGIGHAEAGSSTNPSSVSTHSFVSDYGHDTVAAWSFNDGCHGGVTDAGVSDYNLGTVVFFDGVNGPAPCVMMSDPTLVCTASYNSCILYPPSPGDIDGDGIDDVDDNCPGDINPGQEDIDGDGLGDTCDAINDLDPDIDGVFNDVDNCPDVWNADQTDTDGDGIGDECDPEPTGAGVTVTTSSGSGLPWTGDVVTFSFEACAGGAGTFALIDEFGNIIYSDDLIESPTGVYTGTIASVPFGGTYTMNATAVCAGQTDNVTTTITYLDPSGQVFDCAGDPIAGVEVTLYRSDNDVDPVVMVPDGSTIMSPDNRDNPSFTTATGNYRWDTTPGWYQVSATIPGEGTVTSDLLVVPPERFGVDLVFGGLNCPVNPGDVTLSGTVLAQDGSLVEGATLELLSPADGSVITSTTTSNGAYSVNVAAGIYTVRITPTVASGYLILVEPIVDMTSTTARDFVLAQPNTDVLVSGSVFAGSVPLVGVGWNVCCGDLGDFSGVVDGNGAFSFDAEVDSYTHIYGDGSVGLDGLQVSYNGDVHPAQDDFGLPFAFPAVGSLTVNLVDGSGNPVDGDVSVQSSQDISGFVPEFSWGSLNWSNSGTTSGGSITLDAMADGTSPVNLSITTDTDDYNIALPSGTSTVTVNVDTGGTAPVDGDGDGIADIVDNCVDDFNADQADLDLDGLGDVCDPDADGDGSEGPLGDSTDCDDLNNSTFPGAADDTLDGIDNDCDGDVDEDVDSDLDGVPDTIDNCPHEDNSDQADLDGDLVGDFCDDDADGDGSGGPLGDNADCDDTNETIFPGADDDTVDGIDNDCDGDVDEDVVTDSDSDNDGVGDTVDNCPTVANADQADDDSDGTGNACDCGSSIYYTAGQDDDFAAPTEPAAPSTGLALHVADRYAFADTLDFDEFTTNRFFVHTFDGLQQPGMQICAVEVTARIHRGDSNDNFSITQVAPDGTFLLEDDGAARIWEASLSSFGLAVGESGLVIVDPAVMIDGGGRTHDFAAHANELGYIDIRLQDDSAIDFLTLHVQYQDLPDTDGDGIYDDEDACPTDVPVAAGGFGGTLLGGGLINTIAGLTIGITGDGCAATSTMFRDMRHVTVHGGDLYVADPAGDVVRRIDEQTGIVYTVAGNGIEGQAGDGGQAIDAELASPRQVVFDSTGLMLIVNNNPSSIRAVDPSTGVITTVATLPGAIGSMVLLDDATIIYADQRSAIKQVDLLSGTITTVASGFQTARDIAVLPNGDYVVADSEANRVYRVDSTGAVTVFAGNGSASTTLTDGVDATTVPLRKPYGVDADAVGNVFIAGYWQEAVRAVTPAGTIYTLAGDGTRTNTGDGGPAVDSQVERPISITEHGGTLYVSSLGTTTRTLRAFTIDGLQSDGDSDGVADMFDNCPNVTNADQADLDGDGLGDVCDPDADGDGFAADGDIDCDDTDPAINSDAVDIPANGIDEDCDGQDAPDTVAPTLVDIDLPSPTSVLEPGETTQIVHLAFDEHSGVTMTSISWSGPGGTIVAWEDLLPDGVTATSVNWAGLLTYTADSATVPGLYETASITVTDVAGNTSTYLPDGTVSWNVGATDGPASHGRDLSLLNLEISDGLAPYVCAAGDQLVLFAGDGASAPRSDLQALIDSSYGGETTRDFDETGSDKYFAHTFEVPVDVDILAGQLTTRIGSGGSNDNIHVGAYPSTDRWYNTLAAIGIPLNDWASVALDLAAMPPGSYTSDLLASINANRYVDVVVQDDSIVDYLELSLCTAPRVFLCDGHVVTINMQLGDSGIGTTGNDVILGTDGPDLIEGRAGNDRICGLGGDDTIDGGSGNDRIFADAGNDEVTAGKGDDRVWMGDGNDVANLGAGNDRLVAGNGDDVAKGAAGDDVMFGGDGSDTLRGGSGNDRLVGGGGNDELKGNQGHDVIRGNSGDDELSGGGGDDRIRGNSGDDAMVGGTGTDQCYGNVGADTAKRCEDVRSAVLL